MTRDFELGGGGGAIITSGSGTWTAAVSDPWITLNATSGSAGMPVAYTVSASTNVGQRVGYVYVSGYTHTVTQNGYEADVSPTQVECERDGVTNGKITLGTTGRWAWDAHPNVDWISVSPTHGVGSGTVTYQVAPYYEVATRSGSITVGDKTVTVFQYGSRMKLSTYSSSQDYLAHSIPLTVNALATTTWKVTPNASWISVVDAGNGKGGDTVGLAISENPSYKSRTGTVTIGTEAFTITQAGRTVLEFALNPTTANANVKGGNGLLAVLATPDLPWTAASGANWLTIQSGFTSGSGNGNIVYVASPNPTLSKRTGKITVTPPSGVGLSAKTLTVTQPAAVSSISSNGYEFEASGETTVVEVTVDDIVQWSIAESLDWITVSGSTSRTGPGTVSISASANLTVYPRSGTVTIAGKTFSVSQKARGVELEYDNIVFKTDGGFDSFSVHPDGNVAWTAVASDSSWITVFGTTNGVGDAEVEYVISPYVGDGSSRTGWIQVGSEKVYITQRPYDLDISPRSQWVNGNSGAGEVGVAATIGDVWKAIVTEPWITIVSGYDAGTGNGTVRFTYTENNTGKTRTGKIIVAGEAYTLTQEARILVKITSTVDGHGQVNGAVPSLLNSDVELTAVPDDGYAFVKWTGDAGETTDNPLTIKADVAKSVTAHFAPLKPAFTSCVSTTNGVSLAWSSLAWATSYRIYRATTNTKSGSALATVSAAKGCSYEDKTGSVGTTYWYWVEAVGTDDATVCETAVSGAKRKASSISYTGLRGATNSNPGSYAEGDEFVFVAPGSVTGYTFAGWTPSSVSAETTGDITVSASWTANSYSIKFNANGGSGSMSAQAMTYDVEKSLRANAFVRGGYTFAGWAKSATGSVVYADGAKVKNLTGAKDGSVTLYAVWTPNHYTVDFNGGNGGSGSMESQPMTYDEEAALYENLFGKTGYTFLGWTDDEEELEEVLYYDGVVVSNLTEEADGVYNLYAVWQANEYWVVFNANGGTGTMSDQAFLYDEPQKLNANGFVRTGYSFTGWAKSAGGSVAYAGGAEVLNLTAVADDEVTLFAKWSANPYTIVFDANGGEGEMASLDCTYGTSRKLTANAFTRTGYTFAGWATSASGSVVYKDGASVSTLAASGTATLYAKWTPVSYAVRFNADGGSGSMSNETLTYDTAKALTANAFTRAGYTFAGWAKSAGGAAVYADKASVKNLSSAVGAVVDLYATWTANSYSVVFNSNGGSGTMTNEAMTYDSEEALRENAFTKAGYTFAGWAKSATGSVVYVAGATVKNLTTVKNGSVTLYAVWTPNHYTVDFNGGNGGSGSMESQPMTYDEEAALYENLFQRKGYTFLGWTDDEEELEEVLYYDGVVVSNLTEESDGVYDLYAVWAANEYRVTFNANKGSGAMASMSFYYDETRQLPANGFVRTGYAFVGWAKTANGAVAYDNRSKVSNLTDVADGEVTLYAKWSANPYVVVFDANGGEGEMTSCDCTYGSATILPENTFTRSGYVFAGWAKSASGAVAFADRASVSTLATSGTTTLYAKWTPVSYAVRFNANGGSGSMSNETLTYDASKALTANAFAKAGYTFAGWAKSAGGAAVYADKASVKNLSSAVGAVVDLYATWTANSYSVVFNSNGGSGTMTNEAMTYDSEKALRENAFTKAGYTFAGWAKSATGSVVYVDGATVKNLTTAKNGSATLYAVWMPNHYMVDFNGGNGGSGSMGSQPMTYDEEAALYENLFQRKGYTFLGWTDDEEELEEVLYYDGVVVSNLTEELDGVYDLYAVWVANEYSVRFNANGGSGSMSNETLTYDTAKALTVNAFTKAGYTFAGWAKSAGGAVVYADKTPVKNLSSVAGAIVDLYAKWTANSYSVTFNANGGSGTMNGQSFVYGQSGSLSKNAFARKDYLFLGWATSANGKSAYADGASVRNLTTARNGTVILYAVWKLNAVKVTMPDGTVKEVAPGSSITLPAKETRGGSRFVGWSDGTKTYPAGSKYTIPSTPVKFVPVFEPLWLYDEEDAGMEDLPAYAKAATVYDGYIADANGDVKGTLQVKVAKAKVDRATGALSSKVTATVQLADGTKKLSFKGGFANEYGEVAALVANGHVLSLMLGDNALAGSFDDRWIIDGGRNVFSSKDAEDKALSAAKLAKWQQAYNVVGDGAVLGITVGKKGKTKIAGTVNGVKVSATSQLIVGKNGVLAVPVMIFKKANIAFNLWLTDSDGVSVAGLGEAHAGIASALKSGAKTVLGDISPAAREIPSLFVDYLPGGVSVAPNGTKWVVADGAKAGKIAFLRGTTTVDEAKAGSNPSALKLTYKAKDGSFKGSFKAYGVVNGRPKAYSFTVLGVVMDGVGYGTATLKKPAVTIPITIE